MTLWRLLVPLSLACLCTVASADLRGQQDFLSAEERAWVASHPVVRVAVASDSNPIQYMENGQIRGLSAEFLKVMEKRSGLQFRYVLVSDVNVGADMLRLGRADLLPVMRPVNAPLLAHGLRYTRPRESYVLLVITRAGEHLVSGLRELNGKTIGMSLQPYNEAELNAMVPDSKFVKHQSALDLLNALASGKIDAALATELYTLPYLHRRFKGVLQIAGALSEYSAQYNLAVSADQPLMYSVVQKTLDTITDEEGGQIYGRWLATDAFDAPPLDVLAQEYLEEFLLAALVFVLLSGLVYQTHRQRRRSIRSERDKARFLAVMSHEIRSPMNAILAAVELLRQTPLNKAQRHFADLADGGGDALLGLLDDVLDYSRLEAGQLELACKPVDVAALARRVANAHRARADEKQLALTVAAGPDACWLLLDEARVAQVLHNLVSNAIKFTDTGSIEVRVSAVPSNVRGHVQLAVAVVDTGIGIVLQNQARLFQPYAQAANTYKRSGGTGLGLAVCGQLAALMRGAILLDSEPGKGTTVTLSIPAETTSAASPPTNDGAAATAVSTIGAEPSAEPAADRPAAGVRILLVEDSPANQEAIQAQMRGLGCRLAVASNGAQALALFAGTRFDLVLMDCDLPDQDGYTLAAEMRRTGHTAQAVHTRVPILAISASSGTEHIARCFDAGMDGVLGKPVRLAELRNAIALWCDVDLDLDLPQDNAAPMQEVAALPHVREAMDQDVRDLFRAVALRDAEDALRAAHRLHGAALTLGWSEVAQVAGSIETLLRVRSPWRNEDYAALLGRLVEGAAAAAPLARTG